MQEKKQIVVIGGGLGGISAAITLAQQGCNVSLYEKNEHLGGKLNRLEQEGFGFDLGPSILTMPPVFEKMFTKSGKKMSDYVPIARVEPQWRSFFPDHTVIDLFGNLEQMSSRNSSLSTEDMKDYQNYLHYAGKLYEVVEKGYFSEEGLDTLSEVWKHHGLWETATGFDYFSSLQAGINKRVRNPQLRTMLGYFIKYVGSSADEAPAVLNMLGYMQHMQGVWYVPGGMHLLAAGLVKLAEEEGVQFHTGEQVVKLNTDGKEQIVSAQLAGGETVFADYFVSNMEVIPAYSELLQEKADFLKKLEKQFEPAASGLVIHLGIDKSYPQLAHHNFFFSENPEKNYRQVFQEHVLPDDPTIYLVNVNKTDPAQAPAGQENLKILPHIPYIQDKPFTPAEYDSFQERVFEKLERMGLEGLRNHIITENTWRPEDIQAAYFSHRGAIYGTVSDRKKNHGFKHPKHSEKYKNLYFVGGTVNPGGGMPMVTLGGQQVGAILGAQAARKE